MRQRLRSLFLAILILIGMGVIGAIVWSDGYFRPSTTVSVGSLEIRAERAETQSEWTKGLSGRASLAPDEGMLFVFDDPGIQTFWMKDMNFPLDIIWINTNKTIVDIDENIQPLKDGADPVYYESSVPILYVLEVNAGVVKENGIQAGNIVSF